MMMNLSITNSAGERVGVMGRIYAAKMQVGSKVCSDTYKGVYEIAEVLQTGDGPKVKLKLLHKCVTMDQLWAVVREAKAAEAAALVPPLAIAASFSTSKAGPTRPPATLCLPRLGGFGRT